MKTDGPVRVKRSAAGAEDIGADQVDLQEHAERDGQRNRDVQPGGTAPHPAAATRARQGLDR